MPFSDISLRKLMVILGSSAKKQPTKLKEIKRQDQMKITNPASKGMDFHVPFWSDAKKHIGGEIDLKAASKQRAQDNKNRRRLYPMLADGFLLWWNEKSRWTNEGYSLAPGKINGQYSAPTGGNVKVDNLIWLKKGESENRIIYPYFSEKPILQDNTARLGLWVMSQAILDYPLEDFRILDVLRGKPFSSAEISFCGDEKSEFEKNYGALKAINDTIEI